ncbi:MAG: hypothetical protein R3F11_32615 [Verrucomicrobiales bacterium]
MNASRFAAALAIFVASISPGDAADKLGPVSIAWEKDMLSIKADGLPGEKIDIWYIEACCRPGGQERDWHETTIPHKTEKVSASEDGRQIVLKTAVEGGAEMIHTITAGEGEVSFDVVVTHKGDRPLDFQWFQPCMRVGEFTGLGQEEYWKRCFLFAEDRGFVSLGDLPREEEARYKGGQVYLPKGRVAEDMNPRPLSKIRPANGLIGAVSADDAWLVAMAWDHTHELFQGVIKCIHNDPYVGGLKPGETKKLRGKVYLSKRDPEALLKQYHRDFPDAE